MILEFLRKIWSSKPKLKDDCLYQTTISLCTVMEILQKQGEFSKCQHELLETLFSEINSLNELTTIFYKWAEIPEPISDNDRIKALQTWDQLQAAHRDALSAYSEIIKTQAELMIMANEYQKFMEKINEN